MDRRKISVITGAANGIGTAYARYLKKNDHDLILIDKDSNNLTTLVQEL